jgi:pimeloyl-ACP methyl ester carboxylesterase
MKAESADTRRHFLKAFGALLAHSAFASPVNATASMGRNIQVEYGRDALDAGIRSRYVDNNNGITMHVLEAGFEHPGKPCVVLLHGFPELAYTWRNQLLPLAAAGYHVIAPDLRGYGRSTGVPVGFDDDLLPYTWLNRVSDVLGLVRALGFEQVAARFAACLLGVHLIHGAGHWMAEEQPQQVNQLVIDFLQRAETAPSRQ